MSLLTRLAVRRVLVAALALLAVGCGGLRLDPRASIDHVTPRDGATGPRIVCIVAHHDDETAFAATLYKATTALDAVCDLVILTNGEGGYKYSTLGERVYGLRLTNEAIGRKHLPAIRRAEDVESSRILGIRRLVILGQKDHRYTRDAGEVLGPDARVWDLPSIRRDLDTILRDGRYEFVFTHLPTQTTHGHHKAATTLALQAVDRLPAGDRPVVLGAGADASDLDGPAVQDGAFRLDRTQKFGFRERLDYHIVVNWVIAAHKSQGTMQLAMNGSDTETFWLYRDNPSDAQARAAALFTALAKPQFAPLDYPDAKAAPPHDH